MPLPTLVLLRLRYLDLLKRSLLGTVYLDNELRVRYLKRCVEGKEAYDPIALRDIRKHAADDWFAFAASLEVGAPIDWKLENLGFTHTMIGRARLENVDECFRRIHAEKIPGDLMECGVWRGGAAVLMRGLLEAYDVRDRVVWVADSFEGLPPPTTAPDLALEQDLSKEKVPALAIDLDTVQRTFDAYGLLDDRVKFLPGWFKDTLPHAPVERLAMLRLDADLYESTRDALDALYDKVSPGGFIIVDDLFIPACRQAVDELRAARGDTEPLVQIDWQGAYWRKRR